MRLRFWQREEEPWQGEAELSRPWVDEALSNREAAELQIAKTRSLLDAAVADVLKRGEAMVAELEAADDRLVRLEKHIDRLEGPYVRGTEARLAALEHCLRGELGLAGQWPAAR